MLSPAQAAEHSHPLPARSVEPSWGRGAIDGPPA